MRNTLFLLAPVCLLLINCESDDSYAAVERTFPASAVPSQMSFKNKAAFETIISEIQNSLHNFPTYDPVALQAEVEAAAFKHQGFLNIAQQGYVYNLDYSTAAILSQDNALTVSLLSFSNNAKSAILAILSKPSSPDSEMGTPAVEGDDKKLIDECGRVFDTGDDDRRDKRTLAYAQGRQYSQANAIIACILTQLLEH